MVRFEDLLYRQEETTKTACECAGGTLRKDFVKVQGPAKTHGGQQGEKLVKIKYGGNSEKRFIGWTKEDIAFLRETVDKRIMEIFDYRLIDSQ